MMCRGFKIAAIAFALGACSKEQPTADQLDLAMQSVKIDGLMNRVNRLESTAPRDYVHFKAGDGNFEWLWMPQSHNTVRMRWESTAAQGSGSRVSIGIGNPLAMGFSQCTIRIVWGATDSSGTPIPATRHEDVMRIGETLPAGGFAFPTFDLPDLPPSKLGFLIISDLMCLKNEQASFAR